MRWQRCRHYHCLCQPTTISWAKHIFFCCFLPHFLRQFFLLAICLYWRLYLWPVRCAAIHSICHIFQIIILIAAITFPFQPYLFDFSPDNRRERRRRKKKQNDYRSNERSNKRGEDAKNQRKKNYCQFRFSFNHTRSRVRIVAIVERRSADRIESSASRRPAIVQFASLLSFGSILARSIILYVPFVHVVRINADPDDAECVCGCLSVWNGVACNTSNNASAISQSKAPNVIIFFFICTSRVCELWLSIHIIIIITANATSVFLLVSITICIVAQCRTRLNTPDV